MPALVACMVGLACLVAGCGKPKEEVYPAEGHAYMHDPVFKAAIAKQEAERKSILARRQKLIVAFQELEKRAGSRAAAEKLPEWAPLRAEADQVGRDFESNRWHTIELMRARMKRAQEDSARIARGEAKAKKDAK